jgi:hypothetical protein
LGIIDRDCSGILAIGLMLCNHIRFFLGDIMARTSVKQGLPIGILALGAIAYIAFGDAFLPGAAGRYSYQARLQLNAMMIKVFPGWKTQTNPNRRTEDAVDRMEGGKN